MECILNKPPLHVSKWCWCIWPTSPSVRILPWSLDLLTRSVVGDQQLGVTWSLFLVQTLRPRPDQTSWITVFIFTGCPNDSSLYTKFEKHWCRVLVLNLAIYVRITSGAFKNLRAWPLLDWVSQYLWRWVSGSNGSWSFSGDSNLLTKARTLWGSLQTLPLQTGDPGWKEKHLSPLNLRSPNSQRSYAKNPMIWQLPGVKETKWSFISHI